MKSLCVKLETMSSIVHSAVYIKVWWNCVKSSTFSRDLRIKIKTVLGKQIYYSMHDSMKVAVLYFHSMIQKIDGMEK